jgi:hypothetical protein
VFRIHDIFDTDPAPWIRTVHWVTDTVWMWHRIRFLLFSSVSFMMHIKNVFYVFLLITYYIYMSLNDNTLLMLPDLDLDPDPYK